MEIKINQMRNAKAILSWRQLESKHLPRRLDRDAKAVVGRTGEKEVCPQETTGVMVILVN